MRNGAEDRWYSSAPLKGAEPEPFRPAVGAIVAAPTTGTEENASPQVGRARGREALAPLHSPFTSFATLNLRVCPVYDHPALTPPDSAPCVPGVPPRRARSMASPRSASLGQTYRLDRPAFHYRPRHALLIRHDFVCERLREAVGIIQVRHRIRWAVYHVRYVQRSNGVRRQSQQNP